MAAACALEPLDVDTWFDTVRGTPGADDNSFPLYSLADAQRLRSRVIAIFDHIGTIARAK